MKYINENVKLKQPKMWHYINLVLPDANHDFNNYELLYNRRKYINETYDCTNITIRSSYGNICIGGGG